MAGNQKFKSGKDQSIARCLADFRDALQEHGEVNAGDWQGVGCGRAAGGSVQRERDRIRINVHLIAAAADHHLWAEAYDRDLRDVLILQNEVAHTVAKEIQVKLTPDEDKRLSSRHTVDPDAYRLYLRGRYFRQKRNEQSFQEAIAYFS